MDLDIAFLSRRPAPPLLPVDGGVGPGETLAGSISADYPVIVN